MQSDDKLIAYVQSRLTPQERDEFEGEMAQNPALSAQVAALASVRTVMEDSGDEVPSDGWARFSDRLDIQNPVAVNDNRPFRLSLLQAACVAVLAVVGWEAVDRTLMSEPATGFVTASADIDGPAAQVIFAQGTTIAQINALLLEVEGAISRGPSAIGMFMVTFTDEAARDAAIRAMTTRSDIVSEVFEN